MYQPELYKKCNRMQREDSKKFLDMYFDYVHFRAENKGSLLDIGCGTGDVLMDIVYPKFSKSISKVTAIDISATMIQYSATFYSKYENVEFKVLDITTNSLPIELCGKFGHIVSFYCLNWISDLKQTFNNIYDLMIKNGDFLVVFPISSPMYDAMKAISLNPKWIIYMEDVDRHIPKLQNNPDPQEWFSELFNKLCFADVKVNFIDSVYYYEGGKKFGDVLMSINPLVEKIPLHKRNEFQLDLLEWYRNMGMFKINPETEDYKYEFSYKNVIICGRK